ncbi:MAG: dephospho-CoA kinase [Spirochaetia bacterium]|nr:dephospho-CoA kinase [Spirochaetia bacterium]
MVIGLTGKAAAGKNVVSDAFAEFGFVVIDVDQLGRPVLEQNQTLLGETFGSEVLRDGKVDRKALGALVFSDPDKLRALEAITHPAMVEECKRLIAKAEQEGKEALLINAALLYRMHLHTLCDHVVVVKAPLLVRFSRSRKRENISFKKFMAREKAQQDIRPDIFSPSLPVFILRNGSDTALIHRQVTAYCATIGIGVSSS